MERGIRVARTLLCFVVRVLLVLLDVPAKFPGFYRHFSPQRRVPSIVNMGGVVKTLRRSNSLSRSVFSTAGSFG